MQNFCKIKKEINPMNNKKRSRKGFTIVELSIVIAVIAILAAVMIPVFGNMITNANKSNALQEARHAYTEYIANFNYATNGEPEENFVIETEKDYYFIVEDGVFNDTPYEELEDAQEALDGDADWTDVDADDNGFYILPESTTDAGAGDGTT